MNNSEPTTRKRFYCNKNENEFDLSSMDDTTEAISEAISKGATSISSLSFSWIPDKYHRAPVRYGNLYLVFEKGRSLSINRAQATTMISFCAIIMMLTLLPYLFGYQLKTAYILKYHQSFMEEKTATSIYLLSIRNSWTGLWKSAVR